MKAKAPKKAKTTKKATQNDCCSNPVCKLMMGPKGRAFGKAGAAFYKDYLKIAKKMGNKNAIASLSGAIVEMAGMAKGKVCACDDGCSC